MNMNRKALRVTVCCMATAMTLCAAPSAARAEVPAAGAAAIMKTALTDEAKNACVLQHRI